MDSQKRKAVAISFPATLEFVPMLREFVADSLRAEGFSDKFAYRTEVIVDELCGNAVRYGSSSPKSRVAIRVEMEGDEVSLVVKDEGGSKENIQKLRDKVVEAEAQSSLPKRNLGLEIVKMLAESVEVSTDLETITKVQILRREEESNG